jgi:glycosyltransferase involved in cell wall biosynthesis
MPEPKKIVIIGSAHPLRGGLASFNERLARAFREEGAEVTIFTFSLQYPNFLFPGKSQYSSEPPPADLDIHVAINSVNPFNWLKYGLKIKKMRPDLVIMKFWIPFMGPCLGSLARLIRANRHTKVVTIIDNIIPHEKRPGDRMLAQYFSNSIDAFVAMSRSVLEEINLFDKIKPRVFCPHPLYDNFGLPTSKGEALKALSLQPEFNYILFFGFIRDYKGLDILLDAMADPLISQSNIKLIVAGEFYTNAKPYLDQITALGIAEKVILHTDFIPDSEVYQYFCATDLVVQPYKSATQSGVTQIAYHFEKPMVITNVGGLGEFVPDGKAGFVVDTNAHAVAKAIHQFYEEKLETYMIAQVRELKKQYAWSGMTDAIRGLLK